PAPRHPRRRDNLLAVACIVDPPVLVLGLGKAPLLSSDNIAIATHLLHIDRITQPLHRRDLCITFRPSELKPHDEKYDRDRDRTPAAVTRGTPLRPRSSSTIRNTPQHPDD